MGFHWIGIIAPLLFEYLHIIQCWVRYDTLVQPIAVIDSLIMKIEGMLREFLICANPDWHSFKIVEKNGGQITQVRLLDDILRDPEMEKWFSKDEILFFKFLLVEKAGLNLRHDVAHTIVTNDTYSIQNAHLLFIAFLRIAKFDSKIKEGNGKIIN